MQCPNSYCKQEISNESKFCNYCGTKIESQTRTCPNEKCKRSGLPPEANFCPYCGTNLSEKLQYRESSKKSDNTSAPEGFVLIPGGTFMMGTEGDDGKDNEKPVHQVTLDAFYMSKTPITQAEYEKVMGKKNSTFTNPTDPVTNVNWYKAKEYCEKVGGRLPSEAEWEYACRAGSTTEYYWGNKRGDEYACFFPSKLHPVAKKKPNAFGLYDMSGNVWEWCNDWYDGNYYSDSPSYNPQGPSTGCHRVIRGGSSRDYAVLLRSANRGSYPPTGRIHYNLGFRCVRSL